MSMSDEGDIGLSAEEQAQFDSMREPGSNVSSPDQLTPPEPTPAPPPTEQATPAPTNGVTPPTPEPVEDEDVETLKDATGKDVIDAKTGKPQKRVSFHKYQRLENQFKELQKTANQTAEERARIDERLKIINEALATPPPAAEQPPVDDDPEPDVETNIFEHNKWLKRPDCQPAQSHYMV